MNFPMNDPDLKQANVEELLSLLDTVQKMIKDAGSYPQLSDFYPQRLTENGGSKLYEVAYSLRKDGIYQILFDPSSDSVDSGGSRMKKVETEEFLQWIRQDQKRILDVYNHLVSFVESSPP